MTRTTSSARSSTGDGYAAGHIDALGEGYGFRKVRVAASASRAFGANAIVLPPRYEAGAPLPRASRRSSTSSTRGDVEIEFGDGSVASRSSPAAWRASTPTTVRRLRNVWPTRTRSIFVVGGKGGYVGRDGAPAAGRGRAPAARSATDTIGRGDRVLRARPRHPRLPGGGRLRAARGRRDARVQRVARPAAARGRRGGRRACCAALNRYPDPTNAALRARARGPLRRARDADRDRQRLLRHPARRRRGAARAGRRARLRVAVVLASTRTSRPRRARRAVTRPAGRRATRHDLDAMLARDHGRHAARDRLQPEQPDEHRACRCDDDRGVRRARCRATSACSSTRPTASSTRSTTPTRRSTCSTRHPNLVLLRTF